MDMIEGVTVGMTSGKDNSNAVDLYMKEILKIIDLGYIPRDSNFVGNSIYTPKGELYLIDFEHWEPIDGENYSSLLRFLNADKIQFAHMGIEPDLFD